MARIRRSSTAEIDTEGENGYKSVMKSLSSGFRCNVNVTID